MIYLKQNIVNRRGNFKLNWFLNNDYIKNVNSFKKDFPLNDFSTNQKIAMHQDAGKVISQLDEELDREYYGVVYKDYLKEYCYYINSCLDNRNPNTDLIKKSILDYNGKVIFKRGTHSKEIFQRIIPILEKLSINTEEISNYIKSFNQTKYKFVFSTNPWDILTMSMRGISSCMYWGSNQSRTLVGSVLDPYCGIIYATDGTKTKYGSYMNYRSVVRLVKLKPLVYPKQDSKWYLFVEGAYPKLDDDDENYGGEHDVVMTDIFRKILGEKIKSSKTIAGVVGKDEPAHRHYIPLSEPTNKLPSDFLSYRDSEIDYI